MKSLIVTADDFGASLEVNEAVERAHKDGILTAASLMVSAPASADAVARAKTMPRLGVGLHLVLVEGRPTLPAAQVPDLVDRDGLFRTDMAVAGARMFFLPRVRRQLESEIAAQFAGFAATGLKLDHVNAHKHFHLHPTIFSLILKIGPRYGMKALRVPCEPAATIRAVEPDASSSRLLGWWANGYRARAKAAGVLTPDAVFGLAWSGALTAERLQGLLRHLPDGVSEIYTHPATGPYPGSAPGYRYGGELAALTAPQAIDIARQYALGPFADFAPGA